MKSTVAILLLGAAGLAAMPAVAGDAVKRALKERDGKKVTLVLTSGKELTGKVASISDDSVRLSELSGQEFFDAVVDLDQVDAVLFRARSE